MNFCCQEKRNHIHVQISFRCLQIVPLRQYIHRSINLMTSYREEVHAWSQSEGSVHFFWEFQLSQAQLAETSSKFSSRIGILSPQHRERLTVNFIDIVTTDERLTGRHYRIKRQSDRSNTGCSREIGAQNEMRNLCNKMITGQKKSFVTQS